MTTRNRRLVVGLLAFVLLYLLALAFAIPGIQNNLTDDVEQQLTAGGIEGVGVTFDGRDGTLSGPPTLRDPALAAVTDRWGIRSLAYRATGPDVVVPTTTGPSTTTLDVTTSAAEPTTTAETATTTTTVETTTTTPTTEPATGTVDATVTINDQSITLAGTVTSDGQAQSLRDAADAAFALQGSVVDQLEVSGDGGTDEAERAVDGLAAFVDGAGLALRSGTGRLVGQDLDVDGDAFSAAAADTFNDSLTSSASDFGLTVNGSVTPGPDSPDDLQSSLTALLGRSGVNFAPDSAELDQRSQIVLDSAAESIKQVPGAQVQIVGYTDSDGSPEANLELSQARADAVREYLVGRDVPADDLTAVGRGEEDPLVPNDTPENKARNRRIELIVLGV